MRLILPRRPVGALYHQVCSSECPIKIAGVMDHLCHHVAVAPDIGTAGHGEAIPFGMNQTSTWCEGLLRRGNRLDRPDVGDDRACASLGCDPAVSDHDCQRLSLIGHIVGGQEWSVRHDHTGAPIRHVSRCQHLQNTVDCQSGTSVDGTDLSGSDR